MIKVYKLIWDKQEVPNYYLKDLALIAKQVFNVINDPNRTQMNISSYCKQKVCWDNLIESNFNLSGETINNLISLEDKKVEQVRDKKEQRLKNTVTKEVEIYNKGIAYWENLLNKGKEQFLLLPKDESLLTFAIDCCRGIKFATPKQAEAIWNIREKLSENGVIV